VTKLRGILGLARDWECDFDLPEFRSPLEVLVSSRGLRYPFEDGRLCDVGNIASALVLN